MSCKEFPSNLWLDKSKLKEPSITLQRYANEPTIQKTFFLNVSSCFVRFYFEAFHKTCKNKRAWLQVLPPSVPGEERGWVAPVSARNPLPVIFASTLVSMHILNFRINQIKFPIKNNNKKINKTMAGICISLSDTCSMACSRAIRRFSEGMVSLEENGCLAHARRRSFFIFFISIVMFESTFGRCKNSKAITCLLPEFSSLKN